MLAARLERADQMVHHLPDRPPRVAARVPTRLELGGAQEPHLALPGLQDPGLDHARHARVLGLGEGLGGAELAGLEPLLLEPGDRPAGVGVEVPLLGGQHPVERLVDGSQRLAHRERPALGVDHRGVAGEDRHAGADRGLREVDRGDVARLELVERRRQLGVQGLEELAAGGLGGIDGPRPADQHDRGGEGVGAGADHPVAELGPHWPGAGDGEAGADDAGQEGLPAGARGAGLAIGLGLLEGVPDRRGESRVGLLGEPVEGTRHPLQEEPFRLLLAAVAVGGGDELAGLGHGKRGEQLGIDAFERPPQPDIEVV